MNQPNDPLANPPRSWETVILGQTTAVTAILKREFPHLSVERTVALANEIVLAVRRA